MSHPPEPANSVNLAPVLAIDAITPVITHAHCPEGMIRRRADQQNLR